MRELARQTIRDLFNSSANDPRLAFEFYLYDRSVTQKLWSTEYYLNELVSLDINNFLVWPSEDDTQSAGSITSEGPPVHIERYCRDINRLLDGFFMNSMSVLDTLAHQISTLYSFQQMPQHIYIGLIKDILLEFDPHSEAGRLLDNQLGGDWFAEFIPYRHCTTHESLITYSDISVSYDQIAYRHRASPIILPDDPQVKPFTYTRNREALSYCQSVLSNIQSLVGEVYEKILLDINRANNVLPIPMP